MSTASLLLSYTGEAVTPKLTVTDGTKYLVEGKDYTVTYYNNTNEGTATVKLTGKGNYSGYTTTSFVISEEAKEPTFFEKLIAAIENFFKRIASVFAWMIVYPINMPPLRSIDRSGDACF